ncbi:MAG TPA: sigma-54 dependent transcriptional regulator [Methylomirabilota bacterium]|nr:sigma-54 dependent transcriptional regulator [Methylomirabilota bacterium]
MAAIATPSFMRTRNRVLVASADAAFRSRILKSQEHAELESAEAVGGAHALAKLVQFPCDNVVLDRHLPDLDAGEVANLIRQRFPGTAVKLIDSRAAAREAQDVCVHETEANRFEAREARLAEKSNEGRAKVAALPTAEPLPAMIGTSRAMQQVYRLARLVAPRDTTVLITGETGTGKELVAQAVHELSPRARQPFVVVNCAAIPEALLEAELFGHVRGAFTGAVQSRLGRIHVAQGGTLFLDEIGELPLSMQAKLLRFLQNGEVQRLGSSDVHRVDVRVVCATNVRLLDLVQAKQFRQDLYYRLAIFPVALPPLRERAEDVGPLATHFLERLAADNDLPVKQLGDSALALLQQTHWAGNVRELQHAIERAFILSGNETQLRVEHFQSATDGLHLGEL